ncbi:membrane protein [Microbacterium nanhaiense]|uniref:Membrane protein n=1 Tax=Microbacterium nanhaiense TaxID=1301026 RepID=A0ABQ2N0D3_9MICO|nr:hemolysin family protein [Microbacterium nanhaiense]GGO62487.1 membrane protein [Microbacterium nanhaiense]
MDWIMLAIGVVLIFGTGIFVASEFSLVNLDRADLESRRERGESGLNATISALRHTSTHLSSAQLGITLTTLLTGYTMEPALSRLLSPLLGAWLPDAAVAAIGTIVGMAIATIASMILGELVPKNFALALPLHTAKIVAPLQIAFTTVFRPAVAALNGSANGILRAVGIEPQEELSGARSAEELSSLVRRSATAGLLEEDTATLLDRSLTFTRLSAGDVMTPRPRMHAIGVGESANDIIVLARETGHSRFPVYDDDLDDVVGIVHLKAAVAVPRERRAEVPAGALQSDALRVPETVKLDQLLGELRTRGYQMAVVVDEYGGTAGVVTLEDLVEEIVGEVSDEHDRRRAGVVRHSGSVTFPGQLRPDEARERVGIVVPESDDYDTVGGYIMSALERVPSVGDSVRVEHGSLEVVRMDSRRVDRVRYIPDPVPEAAESEDER